MTTDILAKSSSSAYAPEDFITGDKQLITGTVTLQTTGGVVAARSVLGIVTASGKGLLAASAATDGSAVARMILAHDVDTTGGDVVAPVYKEGCFNPELLVFGAGKTAANAEVELNDRSIYLKTPG